MGFFLSIIALGFSLISAKIAQIDTVDAGAVWGLEVGGDGG